MRHCTVPRIRPDERALLRGAAGGAAALAVTGIPAWARPVATASRLRRPDSLPFPGLPAGTASLHQIEHVVVLMMENHSFDNLLGIVPTQVAGRSSVDGLTVHRGRVTNSNPDVGGARVFAQHAGSPCQLVGEPSQAWNASHSRVRRRPQRRLRTRERADRDALLGQERPAVHLLAGRALPDRGAVLLLRAGADGTQPALLVRRHGQRTINDTAPTFRIPAANGTIFDRLDAHRIDWADYYQDLPTRCTSRAPRQDGQPAIKKFDQFYTDVAAGRLPQFTFARAELRHDLRREPAGRPGRRAVHRQGRARAHARADVEAHGAVHHLRRARRLLRPRPAAARDQARLDRPDARPGRYPGRV